jgi:cytochrome P450
MNLDTSSTVAPVPPHVPAELVFDFDLYDPPGAREDFHASWKSFQDGRPDMVWTPRNGGHWIAMRGKLIYEIFADHEHFSSKVIIVPRERGEEIKVLPTTLDPPEHGPYRKLLNAGLTAKVVRNLESDIRKLVVDTIEGFRDHGQCEFVTEFAEILPVNIFMRMVDLPVGDALMLKQWVDAILRPESAGSAAEMITRFRNYLRPYVLARQNAPGDDLLSRLITGDIEGRRPSETESIELCTQVMMGGLDTVISFLGFIFLFLARNPGHRRQLVEDPGLIHSAVEEFLRRFAIVQNGRIVRGDYHFHGVSLKEGDMVIIPGVLHSVDEREYDDPLAVNFHRPLSATHSTFGNGVHRCPGSMLARSELKIALAEWLVRIPEFRINPADSLQMCGGIVATVQRLPLLWDV